jgi:hypothetical protein
MGRCGAAADKGGGGKKEQSKRIEKIFTRTIVSVDSAARYGRTTKNRDRKKRPNRGEE